MLPARIRFLIRGIVSCHERRHRRPFVASTISENRPLLAFLQRFHERLKKRNKRIVDGFLIDLYGGEDCLRIFSSGEIYRVK